MWLLLLDVKPVSLTPLVSVWYLTRALWSCLTSQARLIAWLHYRENKPRLLRAWPTAHACVCVCWVGSHRNRPILPCPAFLLIWIFLIVQRTRRPPKEMTPVEPAVFAAQLIARLEHLKREQETISSLEERLQQIQEVGTPKHFGLRLHLILASVQDFPQLLNPNLHICFTRMRSRRSLRYLAAARPTLCLCFLLAPARKTLRQSWMNTSPESSRPLVVSLRAWFNIPHAPAPLNSAPCLGEVLASGHNLHPWVDTLQPRPLYPDSPQSTSITTTSITMLVPKARSRLRWRPPNGYSVCVTGCLNVAPSHISVARVWTETIAGALQKFWGKF